MGRGGKNSRSISLKQFPSISRECRGCVRASLPGDALSSTRFLLKSDEECEDVPQLAWKEGKSKKEKKSTAITWKKRKYIKV